MDDFDLDLVEKTTSRQTFLKVTNITLNTQTSQTFDVCWGEKEPQHTSQGSNMTDVQLNRFLQWLWIEVFLPNQFPSGEFCITFPEQTTEPAKLIFFAKGYGHINGPMKTWWKSLSKRFEEEDIQRLVNHPDRAQTCHCFEAKEKKDTYTAHNIALMSAQPLSQIFKAWIVNHPLEQQNEE